MTDPSFDRESVLEAYQRHVNRSLARLGKLANLPIEASASGSLVYDERGEAYLDCGGYSVFLLGHRHPKVIEAVKAQLDRHPLSTRVLLNPQLAQAANDLSRVAPAGLDYVVFTNSGAEAVEAGLKLARLNGKRKVIAADGGFHGKTLGALSVTGRAHFREPFLPLLPDVEFVPFDDVNALDEALAKSGGDACVILEPVQGENGVVVPKDGYLRAVRKLCDHHDALLILDEVQTGLGRLGAWWGAQREDVTPDILLAGKALGGGVVPVGAALTTSHLFERLNKDPLLHSSTFAGNPLAMAAVSATIETIEAEDIVGRAAGLGDTLLTSLRRIIAETCSDLVSEVRGVGLLIGIEFKQDHLAADFTYELLNRRVILSNSLNSFRVARLTPSALLSPDEAGWLLDAVREAGEALNRRYAPLTAKE